MGRRGGGRRGGEGRGGGGAQVLSSAARARRGRGRTAGRGRGSGEEGVTPATSAARGFARERRGRWAWLPSFPDGRAGPRHRRLAERGEEGGFGVSGVVDGSPGHGRDAAASAVRAATVRQPHHLGEYQGARGAGRPRRGPGGCLVTGTSQVSLRSSGDHLRRSGGHLRPGLRALPSAPRVALDRESATCGSRGRCASVSECACVYVFEGGGRVKGALGGGTEEARLTALIVLRTAVAGAKRPSLYSLLSHFLPLPCAQALDFLGH